MTLDNDLAEALKERARLLDMPFKQVVNDVLRRGLSLGTIKETPVKYRVKPNRSGFLPGVDPLKLNQLNDEIEVEGFASSGRQ